MNRIDKLSIYQLRLLRARANRLGASRTPLPSTVLDAVQAVVGIQAQELSAARLSLRARSDHLTAEAVENSRLIEREIVWSWCLRGTLHLTAADGYCWLMPLLGPDLLRGHTRRFRQLGWDEVNAALGLKILREALGNQGALDRGQISSLLRANRLPHAGQAVPHLIYRAALEGWLCPGPMHGAKPAYVLIEAWIGPLQPLPPAEALSRLALRYLEAFAPAAPQDLAAWSGLKMAQVRQGWEAIAGKLVEVTCQDQPLWMLESQQDWLDMPSHGVPDVRLLGRFDTYLLGYSSRDFCLPAEFTHRVHPGGGIIHRVLLVDGLVQGTWDLQRRGKQLELRLKPFVTLSPSLLPPLQAEAEDLSRFLGVGKSPNILIQE